MSSAAVTPQQTLAQSIRAKYPGVYDDIGDADLESKIVAKYPQYADMSRTSAGTPIQSDTSIGPAPSMLQRTGQEAEQLASSAVNSKFPYVHPLDALSTAGSLASGEIQHYAPKPVTELLLGGQAAGQPMGTRYGLLNNPVTSTMAGAVPLPSIGAYAPEVASKAAEEIPSALTTAKNAVGNFLRDPTTGELKPMTREAARALGASAGYEAGKSGGHGMEGMLIGGMAGPGMADALVPASQAFQEANTASQLEQGINDAQTLRQKELANTERLRNMEAQSIQNRGKQQDILDRASGVGAYAPPVMPEEESSFYSPPNAQSNPQDLISRTRALVKPGVQPNEMDLKRAGDLTQAPLQRLQDLAKFGDKLAQNEINRRLKNP